MTPQRLAHVAWYREHSNLIGYLILVAGVAFALAGVYQNARDTAHATKATAVALAKSTRDNTQRVARQSCLSAKDTRAPLIRYLESTLKLNDTAQAAHILPPSPPALRKLQAQSLHNLRVLTKVFIDKQAQPCPPAP